MKNPVFRLAVFPLVILLCLLFSCKKNEQDGEMTQKTAVALELNKIPSVVMDALNSRFPKAEIHKWTKEEENNHVIYDIEFTQDVQKFEADIKENGTIDNWEKGIVAGDLPEVVREAVAAKYPSAAIKEIMEMTTVHDGQNALEGYEIVLETAGKKDVEVSFAPDGGILEEPGDRE